MRSRRARPPWQNLAAIAWLAFWVSLGTPAAVAAWQTIPLTGVSGYGSGTTLTLVASAEAVLPTSNLTVVWLVERQEGTAPTSISGSTLAYALPRPSLPNMHGEHGGSRTTSPTGRAMRLTPGETLPLLEAMSDSNLAVRFSIVPLDTLPPGVMTSMSFAAPSDRLLLELREGRLAPGQQVSIPGHGTPVALLAVDNPLQIEQGVAPPLSVGRGELTLLSSNAAIRNTGARVATFAVAWIAADAAGPDQAAPVEVTLGVGDAELDEAWQRFGCHLNPGNPSCLTVGLAAACASAPNSPGCRGDSDADTCRDIAEVRAGLDPYQPADCIGSREGQPLLNCLFVAGNLSCDGSRDLGNGIDCARAADSGRGSRPDGASDCGANSPNEEIDCQLFERDPVCDGFGLQSR